MTSDLRPPRLARAIAAWALPAEMREVVIGDLDEEFAAQIAHGHSRRAAARRYWRQALASIAAGQRRGAPVMNITSSQSRAGRSGAADGVLLDLRHALRVLLRSRGFTAIAVLSLAIGIGANAAIFSVIRVLLFDDMAVRAPRELSFVQWRQAGKYSFSGIYSSNDSNYSYPIYQELRAAAPTELQTAGFNFLRDLVVQYADQPALLAGGLLVDGDFFSVLAPPMALGRPLGPADNVDGGPPNVVLSHAFWLRAFGGDPAVVGRAVRVNGLTAQVVGVTGASFRGLTRGGFFPPTDVTVPMLTAYRFYPSASSGPSFLTAERMFWVRMLARARPGFDPAPALQRMASVIPPHTAPLQLDKDAPINAATVYLAPASRGLDQTRPETKQLLYLLMGVVGLILLIACVNLASLMLARGVARQREMAVKRALGAGRARIARGLLMEGLIVAVAGGLGGLLITHFSRRVLTTLLTAGIGTAPLSTQPIEVTVDPALVAATLGLSVLAALLFSLLPAVRLAGSSDGAHIKHQAAGAAAPKLTLGRLLVAIQIGVSIPLVVGAILFLRTISNLGRVDLGFNPEGVMFFRADAAKIVDTPQAQALMYQELLDRIARLPGVTSASLIENVLMSGITSNTGVKINGEDYPFSMNAVGPGFLETMGMRLIAGRAPGIQDVPGAPNVAAINETAARAYFGDTSPIGQTMMVSKDRQIEIVGIVSDSRYERQRSVVKPTFFDSAFQRPGYRGHTIVFRSSMPVAQIEPLLKQAVASVHRDLPVPEIRTQAAQLRESTIRERVFTGMLTLFGGFALLLASIGLHGVTSYSVARRTSEMGIRLALGAQRGQVLWLVLRQVVLLGVGGLVIGIPLAMLLAPLAGTLLFGVAPNDVVVIAAAAVVMLLVASGAGLLPARRAANMDPVKALRTE
ncbi:MAG TPA: ADOP family duplicated permease [Vicinamibacterales bacterium]|nr:ADOP family duplicated permease [Vicinamibacterales bacterium]